jgi:hypothetical protein
MRVQRELDQSYAVGKRPSVAAVQARVRTVFEQELGAKRLDRTDEAVAGRVAAVLPGLDRAAAMIIEDAASWAVDPATQDQLVWAEKPLDHGPHGRAVRMGDGFVARTRADLIGLRAGGNGTCHVVVRDFKAKREVVDPAHDVGILIRGIWVAQELEQARCRWFLAGRNLLVDPFGVDLETVNLMYADSGNFLMRASLPIERLFEARDRIVGWMREMADLLQGDEADVLASPGGLCARYCPYLKRCAAGMAHVRKYEGVEWLQARLGEV